MTRILKNHGGQGGTEGAFCQLVLCYPIRVNLRDPRAIFRLLCLLAKQIPPNAPNAGATDSSLTFCGIAEGRDFRLDSAGGL